MQFGWMTGAFVFYVHVVDAESGMAPSGTGGKARQLMIHCSELPELNALPTVLRRIQELVDDPETNVEHIKPGLEAFKERQEAEEAKKVRRTPRNKRGNRSAGRNPSPGHGLLTTPGRELRLAEMTCKCEEMLSGMQTSMPSAEQAAETNTVCEPAGLFPAAPFPSGPAPAPAPLPIPQMDPGEVTTLSTAAAAAATTTTTTTTTTTAAAAARV